MKRAAICDDAARDVRVADDELLARPEPRARNSFSAMQLPPPSPQT